MFFLSARKCPSGWISTRPPPALAAFLVVLLPGFEAIPGAGRVTKGDVGWAVLGCAART